MVFLRRDPLRGLGEHGPRAERKRLPGREAGARCGEVNTEPCCGGGAEPADPSVAAETGAGARGSRVPVPSAQRDAGAGAQRLCRTRSAGEEGNGLGAAGFLYPMQLATGGVFNGRLLPGGQGGFCSPRLTLIIPDALEIRINLGALKRSPPSTSVYGVRSV